MKRHQETTPVATLFNTFVMAAAKPIDFYRLSNAQWAKLLPEAKAIYDDADQPFPFTEQDCDRIRVNMDEMLEDEFHITAVYGY